MSERPQFMRTDKAITQALISLLKTKPFDKITVQDILEEAPVTRSTFYKHFHDKYEIVEKMQEEFLSNQQTIRKELLNKTGLSSPQLQKSVGQNHEFMEALLHVHTEHVDLHRAITESLESHYLEHAESPHKEVEARVYAQALAAFQLSAGKKADFTFEYMNDVFISVSLKLLGLHDDNNEIRRFLKKRLSEKPQSGFH